MIISPAKTMQYMVILRNNLRHICKIVYNSHKEFMIIVTFLYTQNCEYPDIQSKVLEFAIYDYDRFGKHDQIGIVQVPMKDINLYEPLEEWGEIMSPDFTTSIQVRDCPTSCT